MDRFLEEFAVVRRALITFGCSLRSTCLCGRRWPFASFPPARGQMLADGIAAVVNDKVITYVQINQQVAETEKLLRQNLQGEELFERVKEAKLNVLKALIDRELIIQDFKTQGGFIPDTYTNERINDIIRDEYGGDRVAFIKTLYERGVTMQKYKDEIQDNAIVGYMRNKNVVQTVLVSPYQIEQYYQQNLRLFQQDEQIKVSTIVLRKSLFPSQKTVDGKQVTYDPQEEIAKEILYKLDTGADFADLAKSYSEAGNKDDGGELGWVTQNGKTAIRSDLWDRHRQAATRPAHRRDRDRRRLLLHRPGRGPEKVGHDAAGRCARPDRADRDQRGEPGPPAAVARQPARQGLHQDVPVTGQG